MSPILWLQSCEAATRLRLVIPSFSFCPFQDDVLLQAEAIEDMTHALAACDRWAKLDCAVGGWKCGYPVFHGGYGLVEKDLTGITLFDCNNSSLIEQVGCGL